MKEKIAEMIYDFAYVSGDGGTSVNSEAVDKIADEIITLIVRELKEIVLRNSFEEYIGANGFLRGNTDSIIKELNKLQ